MKVLLACEESQAVCKEFRKLGHEAYSCDILECGGGEPQWHIQQDVIPLLNGSCVFKTADGLTHPPKERSMARSKTFQGIAKAIADQWGKEIDNENRNFCKN